LATSANNNTFIANTINTSGTTSFGIFIASSNNSVFNNTLLNNLPNWISTGADTTNTFVNTTFLTENGSIAVLTPSDISGAHIITQEEVNITQNRAFLNSSNLTFFNGSSQITLNSIGFLDPKPRKDSEDDGAFDDCVDPDCVESIGDKRVVVC